MLEFFKINIVIEVLVFFVIILDNSISFFCVVNYVSKVEKFGEEIKSFFFF